MISKFSLINKKRKNQDVLTEDSPSSSNSTRPIHQNKYFDKKLVNSLNRKKIPNLKQLKHLGKVISPKQRLSLYGLSFLILASLVTIGLNYYFRNYLPTPAPGGSYIEGLIGAPQYINPLLSQTNDVDSDITRLVFSGLMKYDTSLQLIPDLAQSWEASEDKKTYTFVLKQDLFWHDGEPLTTDDVIFTFQSIKDPDFKSPLLISLRGVTVNKVDARTIQFILPDPYPSFLEVLTVGILPEHIWGEIPPVNANLTEYNLKPVGSGPWKFQSFLKDSLGNIKSFTLVPFDRYHGSKPYLQELSFKFYPDFQTAVAALKNKSVEGISFLPRELRKELIGRENLKHYSFYLPQYTAVFFNQKQNDALKEKSVRKALAIALDKSKILTDALQLEGEIIEGPILPVTTEVSEENKLSYNPGQANLLLDDADWEKITPQQYQAFLAEQQATSTTKIIEENSTTTSTATSTVGAEEMAELPSVPDQEFFRIKDDKILEVNLTTVSQPENITEAELIAEMWRAVGFKVNLRIVDNSKIRREIIKPRNFDTLLFGIIVGSNPDPYPFWHSSQVADPGLNLAQYANREVDRLLEEARTDADKQLADYQRFQDILVSDIPAIFLHSPTYTYVIDQKIKGLNADRIIIPADRFNNIENWYIKSKRINKNKFY